MNILLDVLPETVEIDGTACPINTDFYTGVQFELLMQDRTLTEEEKIGQALALYYPTIPWDLTAAMDGLLWFYSCGRYKAEDEQSEEKPAKGKRPRKAYDFGQDADLIFAAFWAVYGIDLNAIEGLHWWKFRALFAGLPAECEFCKVMGYRTMDTKGLSKKQKQHYERMKQIYALKNEADVSSVMSLAERNQRMKDYVDRRFAEVEVVKD